MVQFFLITYKRQTMCTVTAPNLMNSQMQTIVAKRNGLNGNKNELKQNMLRSTENSLTIQFERDLEYLDFAHSIDSDVRIMLVDVPNLLREYKSDRNYIRSWSVLLKTNRKQNSKFLRKTKLSSQMDVQIKELSDLDKIRLHIAKNLGQNVEVIVLLNPSVGFMDDFYDLLLDIELYLPQVKTVILDKSIWPVTQQVWQIDPQGNIRTMQSVAA